MKGLKILLCGLGLLIVALFCVIAGPYGNYIVGIIFGVLFLVLGLGLMVVGLLVGDSLSELKSLRITMGGDKKDEEPEEKKDDDKEEKEDDDKE